METVLARLNQSLHHAMAINERVVLLGEDILDPYGGSFKVTKGLSGAFPERVMATPISEAGIVGIATGMAMRGYFPVVEIMFGDFVTLIADQLINHLTKFPWMYGEDVNVPVVIRTPMGGRRGYGPTHSQTLEKHYLGVPGLVVLAPTAIGEPGELLLNAILREPRPVLFVENKLLYASPLFRADENHEYELKTIFPSDSVGGEWEKYPTYSLSIAGAPQRDVTIVAYGYMVEIARKAMYRLAYEEEIFAEMIVPTMISPFNNDPVLESVKVTGRLLVVEEGTRTLGWGAEVVAEVVEGMPLGIKGVRRVASEDSPIPASGNLEKDILPGEDDIMEAVRALVESV